MYHKEYAMAQQKPLQIGVKMTGEASDLTFYRYKSGGAARILTKYQGAAKNPRNTNDRANMHFWGPLSPINL